MKQHERVMSLLMNLERSGMDQALFALSLLRWKDLKRSGNLIRGNNSNRKKWFAESHTLRSRLDANIEYSTNGTMFGTLK